LAPCAPTAKEREIVERAAGFGLPHDKICQLIVSERTGKPIDAKTLRAVFRAELDRGVAVVHFSTVSIVSFLISNCSPKK